MNKNTVVKVMIDSKEDYTDKFNEDKLSQELSNYILEECKGKPLNNSITIDIKLNYEATIEEQEKLIVLIRKNYGIDVKENLIHLKHSLWRKLFVFAIGIMFLLIYYFAEDISNFLLAEISLILGWGAIWETVYSYTLDDNKRRLEIKRLKQLAKCKINFE